MKRALRALWKGLATGFSTLTAAIIVVMLCAVIFAARQVRSSASAPSSAADSPPTNQPTPEPPYSTVVPPVAVPIQAASRPSAQPTQPATLYEHVQGYTRKDGTVVHGYYRTKADGDKSNNWSEKGNVNPLTGKPGTQNQ